MINGTRHNLGNYKDESAAAEAVATCRAGDSAVAENQQDLASSDVSLVKWALQKIASKEECKAPEGIMYACMFMSALMYSCPHVCSSMFMSVHACSCKHVCSCAQYMHIRFRDRCDNIGGDTAILCVLIKFMMTLKDASEDLRQAVTTAKKNGGEYVPILLQDMINCIEQLNNGLKKNSRSSPPREKHLESIQVG